MNPDERLFRAELHARMTAWLEGASCSSALAAQPLPPRSLTEYERVRIALAVLCATRPNFGLSGKALAFEGDEREVALLIVRAALGMSYYE